jgi:hypothetical protein
MLTAEISPSFNQRFQITMISFGADHVNHHHALYNVCHDACYKRGYAHHDAFFERDCSHCHVGIVVAELSVEGLPVGVGVLEHRIVQ